MKKSLWQCHGMTKKEIEDKKMISTFIMSGEVEKNLAEARAAKGEWNEN